MSLPTVFEQGTLTSDAGPSYSSTSMRTTSTYREPEPGLIEMCKEDFTPKKSAKVCMCCNATKFGLFNGKYEPCSALKSLLFASSMCHNTRLNCKSCGQVVCGACTQRRHPLHKKLLICKHCYSKGMVGAGGRR